MPFLWCEKVQKSLRWCAAQNYTLIILLIILLIELSTQVKQMFSIFYVLFTNKINCV